jgi:tRNA uridine 5-carbamoylmethylation protein Kti12
VTLFRLDELRKRFESPNDNNRWDNPLFKVRMFKPAQKEVTENDEAKSVFIKAEAEAAAAEASKPKKSSWKPKKKVPASIDAEKSDAATESDNQTVAPSSTLSEDLKALSFSGSMVNASEDLSSFDEYEACLDKIFDHLSNASVPLPNISTVVHQHADADLLYELDRTSQKIIQSIVNHQSENIEGTPIKFLEFDRAITLHRQVTLAELQRYKGQYVKINAQHPPNTSKAIGASFIDFLAVQL